MTRLALVLLLASTLQAQDWNFRTTGGWSGSDSVRAGAIFSVFANIYTREAGYKHPQLMAILFTMAASMAYEFMRVYIDGKQGLALNPVYAGIGAMPVSVTFKLLWGNGKTSFRVGQ
jgi:hypothetical protein